MTRSRSAHAIEMVESDGLDQGTVIQPIRRPVLKIVITDNEVSGEPKSQPVMGFLKGLGGLQKKMTRGERFHWDVVKWHV